MSCFCGSARETHLSEFERKAAPVLKKLRSMKDQHTQMAHAHNEQFQAARLEALKHHGQAQPVLAFADVLEALRHERQCRRLMDFVRQIGDSISKIDSVWASHSVVEGFEQISEQLGSLARSGTATEDGGGDGDVVEDVANTVKVSQNLHAGFDTLMTDLEKEVRAISVVDDTGTSMDDDAIALQLRKWREQQQQQQQSPGAPVSNASVGLPGPESFLMESDTEIA